MENGTKQIADLSDAELCGMTDDEKIDAVAASILKKYASAFEELAK